MSCYDMAPVKNNIFSEVSLHREYPQENIWSVLQWSEIHFSTSVISIIHHWRPRWTFQNLRLKISAAVQKFINFRSVFAKKRLDCRYERYQKLNSQRNRANCHHYLKEEWDFGLRNIKTESQRFQCVSIRLSPGNLHQDFKTASSVIYSYRWLHYVKN